MQYDIQYIFNTYIINGGDIPHLRCTTNKCQSFITVKTIPVPLIVQYGIGSVCVTGKK